MSRRFTRSVLSLPVAVVLICAGAFGAQAQDYPNRRIRFIVPHPAGALVDALARLIGQRMSETWGQPVIIENRLGANGNLGAQAVARAEPDGYTVLFSTNGPLTINVALFPTMGFDPQRELDPVAILCTSSTLIASSLNFEAKSVADVIAMAKKEPGKLSMGTGGHGTGGHFTLAELNKLAGVDIVHVPYRGSTQANADLAAGTIPLVSSDPTAMMPLIQAGRIRALAAAGAERLGQLPHLPTVSETAIPRFDVTQWAAVSVPAGTPVDVVNKLNATINAILENAESRQRVTAQGCNPTSAMTPDAVRAFIRKEVPLWVQRVHDAKLEIQK
jgi:tripartite-type tricarboxylate transporter receptor subunit TctC